MFVQREMQSERKVDYDFILCTRCRPYSFVHFLRLLSHQRDPFNIHFLLWNSTSQRDGENESALFSVCSVYAHRKRVREHKIWWMSLDELGRAAKQDKNGQIQWGDRASNRSKNKASISTIRIKMITRNCVSANAEKEELCSVAFFPSPSNSSSARQQPL